MQYLYEIGCPLNEWCYTEAVEVRRLDIIKYLQEKGCPWDPVTCIVAISRQEYEILAYFYENGFRWNWGIYLLSLQTGRMDLLDCLDRYGIPNPEDVLSHAVEELEFFEYFRDFGNHNPRWLDELVRVAVMENHTQIIKYFHKHGYNLVIAIYEAVERDNLEIFKYLHNLGYQLDGNMIYAAVGNRNIEIVRCLLESNITLNRAAIVDMAREIEEDEDDINDEELLELFHKFSYKLV